MNTIQCPIFFLLALVPLQLNAQVNNSNSSYSTNPPNFNSLSYEQANLAVKNEEDLILAARVKTISHEYITNLAGQVRLGTMNSSNKVLAIYLLGVLRPSDTNSVEVLIECVDFKAVVFDSKSAIMRWGEYPAQEALIKIGRPSIAPIFAHLHSETNQLRRLLLCGVVRNLEGWGTGMRLLRQLAVQESDAERRNNLEMSVKELEKLPD